MASTSLELVRSICAKFERGDYSSAEWAHHEIEFTVVGGPAPGTWSGLRAMSEATRDLLNAWEDFRIEVDEYRELDGERVLVLWRFKGRGKASGLETGLMHATGAYLLQVHAGEVIGFTYYVDRERALAELGLSPEADASRP
jgi:hypothetical protein